MLCAGVLIGLGLLCGCSIWLRSVKYRAAAGVESKISPVSLALQELIAVAGGIYLSLITVISFLKLNVPETIYFDGVEFDPAALSSVMLALAQPLLITILKKVKKLCA